MKRLMNYVRNNAGLVFGYTLLGIVMGSDQLMHSAGAFGYLWNGVAITFLAGVLLGVMFPNWAGRLRVLMPLPMIFYALAVDLLVRLLIITAKSGGWL